MNVQTDSVAKPARTAVAAARSRLRRSSLATLVLVVAEYAIGMYVNLYVTVPATDRGRSLSAALSNGPALLSVDVAVGLLLGLAALGVLVQSIMARRLIVVVISAAGLVALAFASVAGTGLVRAGDTSASMAMSVLTGIALLCYAVNLYVLGSAGQRGHWAARRSQTRPSPPVPRSSAGQRVDQHDRLQPVPASDGDRRQQQ
jgi:hypothetical protein